MSTFGRRFWRWYAIWFVIALIIVWRMQEAGLFDSIGLWYTIYSAAGFALPGAFICAVFGKAVWNYWGPRR
jgi:hypothetical protein